MLSFHNSMGPPSKRKRTVSACSQCRKKKVKCDRGRPNCKVCQDAGKPDQCEYQEPSWEQDVRSVGDDYAKAANIPMAQITLNVNPEPQKKARKVKIERSQSVTPSMLDQGSLSGSMAAFPLQSTQSLPQPQAPAREDPRQFPHIHRLLNASSLQYESTQPLQPLQLQQLQLQQHQQQQPPVRPSMGSLPLRQSEYYPQQPQPPQQDSFMLHQRVEYNESHMRGLADGIGSIPQTPSSIASQALGDTMTFYDYHEPVFMRAGRLVASGPLSSASIIKKDPFSRVTLLKIRKEKRSFVYPFKTTTVDTKELVKQIIVDKEKVSNSKADEAFRERLLENEALDEVKGANKERKETQVYIGPQKVNYEMETIMKIEEVLPNQKVLWVLFDRFFNSPLAAFLPFIHERFLLQKLTEIIGERSTEPVKVSHIRISRRFDFAYIGILLLILRLTYLTVSRTSHNSEVDKFIMENPIGMNAANVAQMCINQFRLLRRGAVPLLQCCLFMRYYHKLAPEDGDGSDGGDSEVFLGMLLQMANSIGLNRDLSKVPMFSANERLINVWRFIWHEIVTLDLFQSFTRGNPMLVDENAFDTKVPEYMGYVLELGSPQVLQASVRQFRYSDDINSIVRPILQDILNIKQPVRIRDLMAKVSKLELYLEANFKSIDFILNLPHSTVTDSSDKIYKLKNYLELKTALYSIYYHIYLNNPAMNFILLQKMLTINMELIPLSYFLLTINNGKTNYFDAHFGTGAQLILVPSLLTSLHKLSQLILSFISRTLDIKYNYPGFEHRETVERIHDGFLESYTLIRDSFQTLSSVYYHAWKASKGISFIHNLLTDEKNNIWDKNSELNKECASGTVEEEFNHLKAIPDYNEISRMTPYQLEQVMILVTSKKFEEPVLKRLNTRSKKTSKPATPPTAQLTQDAIVSHDQGVLSSSRSEISVDSSSTPPLNGFHVNRNVPSNTEVDRLWFQMMAQNTSTNLHVKEELNPLDGSAAGSDPGFTEVRPGQLARNGTDANGGAGRHLGGDIPLYEFGGMWGGLDLEKLINDPSPYDMFGDVPFLQDNI